MVAVVFEGQGHWWLPGRQDTKVPGQLRFDSDTGGTLSLIGALSHWHEFAEPQATPEGGVSLDGPSAVERSGNYPRIFGEMDGRGVTLEDCFQTSVTENLLALSSAREKINVNRVYKDVFWGDGEEPAGNAVALDLAYLDDWVFETAIGENALEK